MCETEATYYAAAVPVIGAPGGVTRFANLRNMLQFLKKFYAGNPKELGNWGAVVDENRRSLSIFYLFQIS